MRLTGTTTSSLIFFGDSVRSAGEAWNRAALAYHSAMADGILATDLARTSAEGYGREALDVELDRQAALARIDGGRRIWSGPVRTRMAD